MAPASAHSFDDPVGLNHKFQRQLLDVQSFVIELHPPLSARPLTRLRISGTFTFT